MLLTNKISCNASCPVYCLTQLLTTSGLNFTHVFNGFKYMPTLDMYLLPEQTFCVHNQNKKHDPEWRRMDGSFRTTPGTELESRKLCWLNQYIVTELSLSTSTESREGTEANQLRFPVKRVYCMNNVVKKDLRE